MKYSFMTTIRVFLPFVPTQKKEKYVAALFTFLSFFFFFSKMVYRNDRMPIQRERLCESCVDSPVHPYKQSLPAIPSVGLSFPGLTVRELG